MKFREVVRYIQGSDIEDRVGMFEEESSGREFRSERSHNEHMDFIRISSGVEVGCRIVTMFPFIYIYYVFQKEYY